MDGGRRVGKEREGWVETRGRRPGKKVLVSVHKDLSESGQSKSSKRRANKRKRVEAELDMPQNGNIEDDEVEGNDADGSFQLEERV